MADNCDIQAGIEKARADELRKKIEEMSDGDIEKYGVSARKVAEDEVIAKKIAKRNAAINLKRKVEAVDYIQRYYADRPDLGLQALLVGTNRARRGSRNSVAARQSSKVNKYTQGFMAEVESAGYWKEFSSGEYDDEIARAVWDLGSDLKISKYSDVTRAVAPIIEKYNEIARLEANAAGAYIGKEKGYVVRQSHDMFKIRKASQRLGGDVTRDEAANFEAWRNFIIPLLDERTFDDVDNRDDFLKSVWQALASGVHLATTGGGDGKAVPSGFSSLAKRMSHDRVLHFKSGDDWSKYNKSFGSGSLRESMLFGLERSARNTAIMEGLGTNPQMVLDDIYKTIQRLEENKGVDRRALLDNKKSAIDGWMSEIDGSINIPANKMLARYSANVRALQSMAKLGGAVISSITDVHNIAGEFRYQGHGFLSGYKAALDGLSGTSAEKKEILGMIGVQMRGMAGDVIHRFSAEDDLGGVMSRTMRTFFKYNGLTWWTDSLRAGSALGFSKNLADNATKGFKDLSADLKRTLDLFAIDEDIWELARKAKLEEADGDMFFTPEAIKGIDDAEFENLLRKQNIEPTQKRVSDLKNEIENKFRDYFVDRVEYAVIEPDARVRSISKLNTQSGTVAGEFVRFIMQFKSFPTSMLLKPLARDIYGRGIEADSFTSALYQALKSGNGENIALAHTIIMSTALGYVAMTAKDVLKGRTPRDPLEAATWSASALQGGGMGIYGDFVFGDFNRFGRSFLSTMAGPTLGEIDTIADLWGRLKRGDDLAASTFRFLLNNTPFANLFYTRIALDYMILYGVQESMNPGYMRRMEKRIKKQNNQTFWLEPTEYATQFD